MKVVIDTNIVVSAAMYSLVLPTLIWLVLARGCDSFGAFFYPSLFSITFTNL